MVKPKTQETRVSDQEVLPLMGDATTAIFLLRDYEKFGLAERVRIKNATTEMES
jgi:hypothetical protein